SGRRAGFRLMLLLRRRPSRNDEIGQLEIGLDAGEGGVEGFRRDAGRPRPRPEIGFEPCLELVVDRGGGGGGRENGGQGKCEKCIPETRSKPSMFPSLCTPL